MSLRLPDRSRLADPRAGLGPGRRSPGPVGPGRGQGEDRRHLQPLRAPTDAERPQ